MSQDKKSGYELERELEELILTLDSVDPEDEDAMNHWLKCLEVTLDQTADKMLNNRRVMELAKNRQDFFRQQRDRYATRFRVQGRVIDRVKEFAHMLLQSHHSITGQSKMSLQDGTWATLTKRREWQFSDAETGETTLDPAKLPACFVKMDISKTELKAAAKRGEDIPGVEYEQVERTHVRWS